MEFRINAQSVASYMAILFYVGVGGLFFSSGSLIGIGVGIILVGAAIGAYYKNKSLLELVLVIFCLVSLISLATLSLSDPDLNQDEIDDYNQSSQAHIIVTSILYLCFFIYFYFLNKVLQFPKRHIVAMLVVYLGVTLMIIYLLWFR